MRIVGDGIYEVIIIINYVDEKNMKKYYLHLKWGDIKFLRN